jgi:hypothetical protein
LDGNTWLICLHSTSTMNGEEDGAARRPYQGKVHHTRL